MSLRDEQREYTNYKKNASKNQYRCKNCCRTIYIPKNKDKSLCPSCGQMVEKNEKNNISHIMDIQRLQVTYLKFQRKLNEQI